jgi:hypothetical protein
MLDNCQRHFRNALEILEPTAMIVQSKGYWGNIAKTFDKVTQITNEMYQVGLGDAVILVAVFAHPSTPDNRSNWGRSADTPYLLNTVAPTIEKIQHILFGLEPNPNKPLTSQAEPSTPRKVVKFQKEENMSESILDYETFYSEMQTRFRKLLPARILSLKPVYKVRSNRMAIYLDRITGSHYEICLRQTYHEIALHFESTPERSLERRRAFDPLLNELSKKLGRHVQAGKHENKGWMRVWIECPIAPLTEKLLAEYVDLFARFIMATFPTLEKMYLQE